MLCRVGKASPLFSKLNNLAFWAPLQQRGLRPVLSVPPPLRHPGASLSQLHVSKRSIPLLPTVDETIQIESVEKAEEEDKGEKATGKQLFACAIRAGVPFIAFGFLDNFLMIVAGDYFDVKFAVLGTMAAAGLGNMVSDIVGVGASGVIDSFARKLGLPEPGLSTAQMGQRAVRVVSGCASAVGISIGCILGMVPLLFMSKKEDSDKEKDDVEEVFKRFNVDKSGLSRSELREACATAGHVISESKLDGLLERVGVRMPSLEEQRAGKMQRRIQLAEFRVLLLMDALGEQS